MDPRLIGMMATAVRPYQKIAVPGETVVIIADTETDPVIWETFAAAAQAVGVHPIVALMVATQRDYADPPLAVQRMAEAADIMHYTTRHGLVHSQWGLEVTKLRKKRIISEGITVEMFTEGAVLADEAVVKGWASKAQKVWDQGRWAHITSSCGTDFRVGIEANHSFSPTGTTSGPAELFKSPFVQFPGGECASIPTPGTGDGVIVVDQSIHYPTGRLTQPVELHMKAGKIVEIRGGWEADAFRRWLESFADENGGVISELAMGCNPEAKFMGNLRQDRFPLGSMHVGFGMNTDVGGTIHSHIHYDAILEQADARGGRQGHHPRRKDGDIAFATGRPSGARAPGIQDTRPTRPQPP